MSEGERRLMHIDETPEFKEALEKETENVSIAYTHISDSDLAYCIVMWRIYEAKAEAYRNHVRMLTEFVERMAAYESGFTSTEVEDIRKEARLLLSKLAANKGESDGGNN